VSGFYNASVAGSPTAVTIGRTGRYVRVQLSGTNYLSLAEVQVWDLLRPHIERYDGAIFTMPDYVKEDLRGPEIFSVPPAIDPLSPKNVDLADETVSAILSRYGVDPQRPMIAQISRFDPWKDPLGVIDSIAGRRQFTTSPDDRLHGQRRPEGCTGTTHRPRAGEGFNIHSPTSTCRKRQGVKRSAVKRRHPKSMHRLWAGSVEPWKGRRYWQETWAVFRRDRERQDGFWSTTEECWRNTVSVTNEEQTDGDRDEFIRTTFDPLFRDY
jgi:hypothetical protein